MTLKIPQGQLADSLNVSQAACYAAMSAKDHDPDSVIGKQMAILVEKLVGLTLESLAPVVDAEDAPAPTEVH